MFKFFLFFLFSTSLFAVDSGTDWWIYSYEDINTLKSVFNYLAMINQDNGYMETLRFAIYTGMVFSLFINFFDITAIPRYFVTAIATMMLVFGTSATVHVVNVKSYDSLNPNIDNYAKIDNVPYIFAILTSCFSNIGYNSALLIETIFTSIIDNEQIMETSFLKAGHMGTYKILTKLDSVDMFSINDNGKLLNKLLDNYLQSCIYDIALSLDPRIKNEITNQSDFMTYLSPSSSSNETIKTIGTIGIQKYDSTSTTCNALFSQTYDLFNLIKNDSKLYSAAKKLASKDTSNFDKAASSVVSMMNQSDLTGTQAKITTYIMNNGLMSAIENSWQNYGVGISSATNSSAQAGFGAGLAISQMQLAGKVKAKSASMILPSMHSVLQAVMYVLFPIILIVQLFAGGIKIIQNYVLGLLWLELWIPSYSVLNYFTTREAQTEAINRLINSTNDTPGAYGILTMANANEIYNTIANEASIAADMYWMIPALAGFILFASFHSISGITGAVAGAVGQYSSTQTLDTHRSEYAALDNVNKELERQNPLYTGDVGSLKQMQSQLQYQGAASVAAGKLLAAGSSSIDSVGNATSPDMFSGMKDMSSTKGELKQTTGGGPLTNAMGKYDNQGGLTGSKVNGDFKATTLDGNLYSKIENSTAVGTLENASTGNSRYTALDSKGNGIVSTLDKITDNEQKRDVSKRDTEATNIKDPNRVGAGLGKDSSANMLGTSEVSESFDLNAIKDSKVFSDTKNISGNVSQYGVFGNNTEEVKRVSGINSAYDAGKSESTANTYGTTSNASSVGSGVGKIEANTNVGKSTASTNLSPQQIQDSANYNTTFDTSRGAASQNNTNNVSAAGAQSGKTVASQNNALTSVNADMNRLNNIAKIDLIKSMVGSENIQTMANSAFKAGYTKDNSVESYVQSLSQKVETTSQDGKTASVITDNQGNIIGKTESKITENGVETYWKDSLGNTVKSDINGDSVNSHKSLEDNSVTVNDSVLLDKGYKENYAVTRDSTVANINPTGVHLAEELSNMNPLAKRQFLNNTIAIDATREATDKLQVLGTNLGVFGGAGSTAAKEFENVLLETKNNTGYNQVPGNPNYKVENPLTNRNSNISMDDFNKYLNTKSNLPTK